MATEGGGEKAKEDTKASEPSKEQGTAASKKRPLTALKKSKKKKKTAQKTVEIKDEAAEKARKMTIDEECKQGMEELDKMDVDQQAAKDAGGA